MRFFFIIMLPHIALAVMLGLIGLAFLVAAWAYTTKVAIPYAQKVRLDKDHMAELESFRVRTYDVLSDIVLEIDQSPAELTRETKREVYALQAESVPTRSIQ